ncbi:MAG TPA: hypothetical protein PK239_00920 [Chitinophagales bacterium]|nr:hypothetical protein [Chitinophagales bacterium]
MLKLSPQNYILAIMCCWFALYVLVGCNTTSQNSSGDNTIRKDGCAEFTVGMPLKKALEAAKNNKNYIFDYYLGTPNSDDVSAITIFDHNSTVLMILDVSFDDKFISSIQVHSPKYKTIEGIHPKMKIIDIFSKTGNILLFQSEGMYYEEMFLPEERNHVYFAKTEYGENSEIVVGSNWRETDESDFPPGEHFFSEWEGLKVAKTINLQAPIEHILVVRN